MFAHGIEGDILLYYDVVPLDCELFFQMRRRILVQAAVDLSAHTRMYWNHRKPATYDAAPAMRPVPGLSP